MKKFLYTNSIRLLYTLVLFAGANLYLLSELISSPFMKAVPFLFVFILVFPVFYQNLPKTRRLRFCAKGSELLILFLTSTVLSIVFFVTGALGRLPLPPIWEAPRSWLINSLVAVLAEALIFWVGMIEVYLSSTQLGIRLRVIGLICGLIPIVNLVVLGFIIDAASREADFENKKILCNRGRKERAVCATKYPILMVHGVFFRDFRYLNYWGRIPRELQENGAVIFYGQHQSAASVADSGREIADRILEIVSQTGCEKVNLIAHSKGGLDCRQALTLPGIASLVASLTTINTPHRGCEFADYLLGKIPEKQKNMVAAAYNAALKKLGDPRPDFLAAVNNLTSAFCADFNQKTPDAPGVFYQSVGSKLNVARGGRFPLNFTYHLCRYFEGSNDGLVSEKSFVWGQSYQCLTVKGTRGISHGDMIDLNRENLPEFDVREFYVQLVSALKQKGF